MLLLESVANNDFKSAPAGPVNILKYISFNTNSAKNVLLLSAYKSISLLYASSRLAMEKNRVIIDFLKEIGQAKGGATPAQVALGYLLEQDIVVIPKTVNKNRMIENINVFDFELSDSDKSEILKLDTDTTLFGSHTDYDFVKYLLNIK